MKMKCNKCACAVLSFVLLLACFVVSHAQVIAIKAGKLVHPESGTTLENQVVLVEAYRAGVTLVYGTDAGNAFEGQTRGTQAISFVDSYVEAGVPPPIILQAMTTNAARLLGVDKSRGALKSGMYANIIATADNPLSNINTLKQVTFVMKEGVVIKK